MLHGASEFDLLRQMLTGVKIAVDRLAPDDHHVADIAREILQLRGKDRKWTQSIAPQELGKTTTVSNARKPHFVRRDTLMTDIFRILPSIIVTRSTVHPPPETNHSVK